MSPWKLRSYLLDIDYMYEDMLGRSCMKYKVPELGAVYKEIEFLVSNYLPVLDMHWTISVALIAWYI